MTKYLLIPLIIISSSLYSQTKISGFTRDSLNIIPFVSVILKDRLSESIVDYTFTDNKGNYNITTTKIGEHTLVFSSLGHQTKIVDISIDANQKNINIDIFLEEKIIKLNEIIIEAERAI